VTRVEHEVRFPMRLEKETTLVTANLCMAAVAMGMKALAEQGARNIRLWDLDGLYVRQTTDGSRVLIVLVGEIP